MSTTEQPTDPNTDDANLAKLEEQAAKKATDLAAAQKAANVAIGRKLLELQATSDVDLFVIGDSGGTFRGIFKAPTAALWQRFKSERRSEQGSLVMNQNLVVGCLVFPDKDTLAAAATKRPALYDVLGVELQLRTGSGQDAYTKG
jgi:hypothetical protein